MYRIEYVLTIEDESDKEISDAINQLRQLLNEKKYNWGANYIRYLDGSEFSRGRVWGEHAKK